MVIVIDRVVRSSPPTSIRSSIAPEQPESDRSEPSNGTTDQVSRTVPTPVLFRKEPALPVPPMAVQPVERPAAVAVEPVDVDPPAPVTAAYTAETLRKYLPGWALAPVPTRVEGPLIQARRAETSLFCCTGANLTVRNCTITLINPANQPFTLVRAEGTTTRGSRIRFEKTLIRGAVSSGFDLGKGSVDVAVRETIFLGSQGPLVRGLDPEQRGDQRLSVVGGVLACCGPGFELKEAAGGDAQRQPPPGRTGV
jgi:hypothetical protein